MARKSRKNQIPPLQQREFIGYKTALYVRLSVFDGHSKDSNSIENQENLLRRYIANKPEFHIISVYRDNGETGVNFQRPEFDKMIEDVKSKKINCIIVKDLSRFGRNYIEAGEYLENIFPFFNVRFIAVNDSYDSLSAEYSQELIVQLLNLTNDVYARDISQKICPVLRAKQERGEFIGAWPAFGYLKNPENKHKLIVDEDAAEIVGKIFSLKAEGFSYAKIINWLITNNIPAPSKYRYEKGIVKDKRWANSTWKMAAIKEILQNQIYLGHMVQGKKRESLFNGQKQIKVPKDDWVVIKNTHEPIINEDVFYKVQSIMAERTLNYNKSLGKYDHLGNSENIFKGIIRCGCCGTLLTRYKNVSVNKEKEPKYHKWYSYICPIHASDTKRCSFTSILESDVIQTVFEVIKVQIKMATDIKKLLYTKKYQHKFETGTQKLAKGIAEVKAELAKTQRLKICLYDDYLDKLMNKDEYISASNSYKEKEQELKLALQQLTQEELHISREKPLENKWLNTVLFFQSQEVLTREMALDLIKNITVYDKQTIHIDFRFQSEYEKLWDIFSQGEV
jgi:Site-specific recombinases, DNA invertase Pin homologs